MSDRVVVAEENQPAAGAEQELAAIREAAAGLFIAPDGYGVPTVWMTTLDPLRPRSLMASTSPWDGPAWSLLRMILPVESAP